MDENMNVKKTPFYEKHVALGAKILPFAGYFMPIQYASILDEHRAVREKVGVFDVTHMGEFIVTGENAGKFLNTITINDISKLLVGQVQYSAMCYPDGGIVDDLLVYRFPDYYMLVVNASNLEKDFNWIKEHVTAGVSLKNISDETSLLAIQGPKSFATLQKLTTVDLESIPFYHFAEGELAGIPMIISRTGYTGERGFELYHKPEFSEKLWNAIFEAGKEFGIQPIGLGARDTLRLEMKYALYGNDIDQTTNPIEAGLGWITKLDKGDFIGRDVLVKVKEAPAVRRNVPFEMLERAIPRHGYKVFANGKEIGVVTSGTQSPTLNKGIGAAYVSAKFSKTGSIIEIDIRGKMNKAVVVNAPFVPSHTL
ncbi:MAG: glycine cleavage system aminomethyltransferase GcvT [Candidatus Neomarinimicrobiota bacterium]